MRAFQVLAQTSGSVLSARSGPVLVADDEPRAVAAGILLTGGCFVRGGFADGGSIRRGRPYAGEVEQPARKRAHDEDDVEAGETPDQERRASTRLPADA